MPPPPMPWITRPTSKVVKELAQAQTIEEIMKRTREGTSSSRRPKISLRAAINGWTTAEVRRKEVPAQKASLAEPSREMAKVWHCQYGWQNVLSLLTGRTGTRMVASRATVREEIARVIMTSHSLFPGFHCSSDLLPFSS